MSASFSLRPATLDDLPSIEGVERKIHRAPWASDHFKAELMKSYCRFLVMTDDETDSQVAGYIVFWMMFDECQILNLGVDLPFRGLGYAQQMIRKAVSVAYHAGLQKIHLEVRKSNLGAIALYEKLQFGISGVRKGFYSDGEDAYEMTLGMSQNSTAAIEF